MFYHDTKKVLSIIKELTVDTDAETWMKGKLCGRESILELQNYYDGKSEGKHMKQVAKDGLKRLFIGTKPLLFWQVRNQDEKYLMW